jgi:hypothetical protein
MAVMQVLTSTSVVTNPNQLPSISLWYNATDGSAAQFGTQLTDGAVVTQWIDLTGAGHTANKSGGSSVKPSWQAAEQNGKGVVQFTAAETDSLDINPIAWAQNLSGATVYVVARALTLDATVRTITTTNTGGYNISWGGTYWRVGAAGGTGQATSLSGDTSNYHIFGNIFDGTQTGNANRLKFRYDGVQQTLNFGATTVGTATNPAAAYMYFGTDNTTYFNGFIGTIMIWTRALNTAECLQVESYLKTVWATP